MDSETVSILLACVGPLVTILVYQWKEMGDERQTHDREMDEINKTLNVVGTLIYDRDIMKKLMMHLAMEDPGATVEAIRELEKRTTKLEDILTMIGSKNRLQRVIEGKINTLKENRS